MSVIRRAKTLFSSSSSSIFANCFLSQVIGKFSIRLVPDMTPKAVEEQVCKYLNELHEKRGSPNDIE